MNTLPLRYTLPLSKMVAPNMPSYTLVSIALNCMYLFRYLLSVSAPKCRVQEVRDIACLIHCSMNKNYKGHGEDTGYIVLPQRGNAFSSPFSFPFCVIVVIHIDIIPK